MKTEKQKTLQITLGVLNFELDGDTFIVTSNVTSNVKNEHWEIGKIIPRKKVIRPASGESYFWVQHSDMALSKNTLHTITEFINKVCVFMEG